MSIYTRLYIGIRVAAAAYCLSSALLAAAVSWVGPPPPGLGDQSPHWALLRFLRRMGRMGRPGIWNRQARSAIP
jgi:hypothetical protein